MERIKVIELDSVDSTNRYLHDYDGEEGELMTVVVSRNQTAGRGHGDNKWESEDGKNLTFSVKVHPENLPANSQYVMLEAMALAIRSALDAEVKSVRSWSMLEDYDFMFGRSVASGTDCRGFTIKWPNDIYWDDLKISGTLSECEINSSGVKSCIIGSGINVNQREFVSDAPNPVSLSQIMRRTVPLKKVFEAVLAKFEHYLAIVNAGEYAKLKEEYMGVLYRRYGSYGYIDGDGEFYARIEDVGPNGHIMLRRDDGMLSEYEFKEVKFKLKQR